MTNLKNRCPGCRRAACDGCGLYREAAFPKEEGGGASLKKINTNKHRLLEFPAGFEAELQAGLGISFDVGTTTLAGMLWDLERGSLLETETAANPQAAFGADVVSRIQAAREEESLRQMQGLLVERLDEMARRMVARLKEKEAAGGPGEESVSEESPAKGVGCSFEGADFDRCPVRRVTVAGNTAMSEIFLGIKPEGLFGAPFAPDYENVIQVEGRHLGFRLLAEALVIVLPPIGGYVGADALAVYGYVSLKEPGKKVLAVDIGTNGEILLQCEGKKYACSAAAGPALEGGAISWGMRAAEGAVDMISLSGRFPVQDVVCRVIGGGRPAGICGSGLVDGLALLWQTRVIDSAGYMRSASEAKAAGTPERLCRRIREDKERRFLLTDESSPVYLTAQDVRQLQLSVSALRCGMEILLKKAGLRAQQLDKIYLAGAFGCYIRVESGIKVGLFPKVPEEKIIQAGNLAGTGAAMALLSPKALERLTAGRIGFERVELADEEGFEELFLAHMNFYDEGETLNLYRIHKFRPQSQI